jgi:RHS repeat-associated protein
LIKVTKNGNMVSEYAYDPEGFRVVKKAKGETTHYVFQGTEPIFEKRISTGKIKSFVYALGKHLARVDGAIGDPDAKKYWYVTDHLGSIRAVTDKDGKKVWSADYLAFGKQCIKDGDFEELHSFTGKEYDPDTGLYYYNARWYDSELGRFVSEDPVADPNNPNLYSYGRNNPLRFVDPTGLYGYDPSTGTISHADGTITDTSGNPISTPPGGSNAGYYYGGVGSIGGGPAREGKETTRVGNVETTWDKDGKKVSETIFDEDGNLKGTKYYSPDGKPQLEYSYNENGRIGSITGYNADGSSLTITFGKNGNITSKVYKTSKEYKGNYRYMSCLEDANPIAAAISAALALLNLAGKVEANVIVDVTVTVTTDNQVTVAVSVRSSLTDPRSGNLEADGDAVLNTIVSVSINNYTGKGLINQMKNSKSIAQGGQAFSTDSSLPGSNSIDSQQFGISAQLPSMYSTSFEVSVTSKSYSMADTSEPGVVSGGWSGGVNITIQGTTF